MEHLIRLSTTIEQGEEKETITTELKLSNPPSPQEIRAAYAGHIKTLVNQIGLENG